jgi:hypothetical protein
MQRVCQSSAATGAGNFPLICGRTDTAVARGCAILAELKVKMSERAMSQRPATAGANRGSLSERLRGVVGGPAEGATIFDVSNARTDSLGE